MKQLWMGSGWKMNLLGQDVDNYCRQLKDALQDAPAGVEVFIVPAFPYLKMASSLLRGTPVHIAAQNMHWAAAGAFTGEVSADMLRDVGVSIVELGHQERRSLFHETDEIIHRKVLAALGAGLRPLICIGETAQGAEAAAAASCQRQLDTALMDVSASEAQALLIAYEPGWAIGAGGIPADPGFVARIHDALRLKLTQRFGDEAAAEIPILYGGSVSLGNAERYLHEDAIDGLFVGRAARSAADFIRLIQLAQALRGK
ncbi:MAG: triose-phosphate isomerase [Anaerolineales bacterium]|nr:triose-phosphate isomerase [Anaerolineales bacterium]